MQCKKGYEIKVLQSSGGFYIGTRREFKGGLIEPHCRISSYWKYKNEAQEFLTQVENKKAYTSRVCTENIFCNGRNGCL